MEKPSEYLIKLLRTMLATCKTDDGIGLAAPQIGVNKRIIMIGDLGLEDRPTGDYRLYVNPAWEPVRSGDPLVDASLKEKVGGYESCLSVPNGKYWIERFDRIVATWFEHDGDNSWIFKREILKGHQARIFQHETDHVDGRSIIDRWKSQEASTRAMIKST
ncbi:MAG: peptide deformylase [Candidatus Paceibacterota bacterium]